MSIRETQLLCVVILGILFLVFFIGLTFTEWYRKMYSATRTTYWATGGMIIIVFVIIILVLLFNKPSVSNMYTI